MMKRNYVILYHKIIKKHSTTVGGSNPATIYLFKVNNRNIRKTCKICSESSIKTPERRHRHHSGDFTVNFEHISHLFLVLLLLWTSKCWLEMYWKLRISFVLNELKQTFLVLPNHEINLTTWLFREGGRYHIEISVHWFALQINALVSIWQRPPSWKS